MSSSAREGVGPADARPAVDSAEEDGGAMSLLGREYLTVAIDDDPPGPGGVRTTTRPRRLVTIRRRVPPAVESRVVRGTAQAGPRRATR